MIFWTVSFPILVVMICTCSSGWVCLWEVCFAAMRASLSHSLLLFGNFLLENTSCGLRTMSPLMKPPFISQVREDRDQIKMIGNELSRKHGFTSGNNVIVMTSGARRAEGFWEGLVGKGEIIISYFCREVTVFVGSKLQGLRFRLDPGRNFRLLGMQGPLVSLRKIKII